MTKGLSCYVIGSVLFKLAKMMLSVPTCRYSITKALNCHLKNLKGHVASLWTQSQKRIIFYICRFSNNFQK